MAIPSKRFARRLQGFEIIYKGKSTCDIRGSLFRKCFLVANNEKTEKEYQSIGRNMDNRTNERSEHRVGLMADVLTNQTLRIDRAYFFLKKIKKLKNSIDKGSYL